MKPHWGRGREEVTQPRTTAPKQKQGRSGGETCSLFLALRDKLLPLPEPPFSIYPVYLVQKPLRVVLLLL